MYYDVDFDESANADAINENQLPNIDIKDQHDISMLLPVPNKIIK